MMRRQVMIFKTVFDFSREQNLPLIPSEERVYLFYMLYGLPV